MAPSSSRAHPSLCRQCSRTSRAQSVYAERELGGFFLDFVPDRAAIGRYGLKVMEVPRVVETAIGGEDIDTTVEGRERYTINVRYPRELRNTIEKLRGVLVSIPARGGAPATGSGGMGSADAGADGGMGSARAAQIPLGQLGQFKATMGPPMIKSEGGLLTSWVYVDITSRDIGGYVKSAKLKVARELKLIPGTYLKWTGQYGFLERIQARMKIVVPLIALLGIATETASIMMVYLDQGYETWRKEGRLHSLADLVDMAVESATL
ncbi:MAG: efflux RND transporter permease subunit [Candidatus Geothermincolia bacterium]